VKNAPNLDVERYRIRSGQFASSRADGNNGQFFLPAPDGGKVASPRFRLMLLVMVSDGGGWEHVSVSVKMLRQDGWVCEASRCPTWEEMCHVKDLFWGRDECVIQFHPRASEYRNLHKYTLHLWRPTDATIPEPNPDFVALRSDDSIDDAIARVKESA